MSEKDRLIDSIKSREALPVRRLLLLLQAVRRHADFFGTSEETLRAAVATQNGLAAFSDDELEIRACSLNTLKKLAQKELAGGWQALDAARLAAQESFQSRPFAEERPGRGTKAEVDAKLKMAEKELVRARCDCWQLTSAVMRLLKFADSYAAQFDIPELSEQVQKNRRETVAIFNFLNNPYDDGEG